MSLLVYGFGAAGFVLWLIARRKTRKPIACLEASREQVLTYVPKNFNRSARGTA